MLKENQIRFTVLFLMVFLSTVILMTFVYAKGLHELNSIKDWVKSEIKTAFEFKNLQDQNLSEEDMQLIEAGVQRKYQQRLFRAFKLEHELKYLELRRLEAEAALARNECSHLLLDSQEYQHCFNKELREIRENRVIFEDQLSDQGES